jgi:hypothetical protein
MEAVSRRVGEIVLKRAWVGGQLETPNALDEPLRQAVTDPVLWHACGTAPGLTPAVRGVISRIDI